MATKALEGSNPRELYDEQVEQIKRWFENFTSAKGTGAAVANCIKLYLNIVKYELIVYSSTQSNSKQESNNQCEKV